MYNAAQHFVLVALVASTVVADEPVRSPSLALLGGTEIRRGDIEYQGPTIVTDVNDPQSPSCAVATIKMPKEARRLLFLMVFDYGGKQISGAGWIAAPSIEGHEISDASTVVIDNTKKISFAFGYKEADAAETFSINGKALDRRAPRVFLVDLTGNEPKLTPIAAALPTNVPNLHSRDAKRKGIEWRTMVEELKKTSPDIKKFMEDYATR